MENTKKKMIFWTNLVGLGLMAIFQLEMSLSITLTPLIYSFWLGAVHYSNYVKLSSGEINRKQFMFSCVLIPIMLICSFFAFYVFYASPSCLITFIIKNNNPNQATICALGMLGLIILPLAVYYAGNFMLGDKITISKEKYLQLTQNQSNTDLDDCSKN